MVATKWPCAVDGHSSKMLLLCCYVNLADLQYTKIHILPNFVQDDERIIVMQGIKSLDMAVKLVLHTYKYIIYMIYMNEFRSIDQVVSRNMIL